MNFEIYNEINKLQCQKNEEQTKTIF